MTDKLEDYQKKKSPVAGGGKNKSNIGIAVIVIAAFALIYFSSNEKNEKIQKQEKFNVTNQKDTSFAQRKKITKKKKKSKTETGLTPGQEALIKQAIALDNQRKAKEKQEKNEELMKIESAKRKSKMIIFSGAAKNKEINQLSSSIQPNSLNDFFKTEKKAESKPYDVPQPSLLDVTQVKKIPVLSRTLTAGKFISGILETAINSNLPGGIRAIVNNDVYSEDGSNVLIPKGTRLIGNYRSGIQQGQTRVYVVWSTAITPGGYQVPLASRGTDALGVSGLSGEYDAHFYKRFGAALLLSVIENQDNGNNQLSLSTQNSLSNASSIALRNNINIQPTIYVDQGEKINIFVARNILF